MRSGPETGELVEELVRTWTEAVGIPASADSDFLAIGGTSLAAVSVAESLAAQYPGYEGIDLFALELIFESSDLLAMAEELGRFMREQKTSL